MRSILLAAVVFSALSWSPPHAAEGLTPDPLRYVAPSRAFDTIHTRLDLDIDLEGQRIGGSVHHRMRSLRESLAEIRLNCVALEIDSVTIDGTRVSFDYPVPGDRSTSWIGSATISEADERLVIHPQPAIGWHQEFELAVYYRGAPKIGLYWVQPEKGIPGKRYEVWSQGEGEDNRHWIPCHDYPNDKSTFEGRFRVARGHYVLSNGTLVSRQDTGNQTEFYWKLDYPQVSYLIMVAAAHYDVHEDAAGSVPLLYVVPPGTPKEMVQRGYHWTPDMVQFFEKTIGIDYPFDKYAQVVVQNFVYGGMENTTATVMNMRTLYDEGRGLTKNEQGLVAHELAHQWWGDMVTSREWSHMWLNEGFATYYQQLYREYHEGDEAFRYEMHERHEKVVERDEKKIRPVVTDFYNRVDGRNNANIYIKGASVLNMLRHLLGDARFHSVMRHYGEKHKYDVVETADFTRAVKDVTGENLDWFFEQWLYLAGHPKFAVSKHWDTDSGLLRLTVRQTQETDDIVPVFRVPVDVEITTAEPPASGRAVTATTHRIVIDQAEQNFYFELPSAPLMVIFDKGDWILKTLSFPKTSTELRYQLEHGDFMARVRAAEWLGRAEYDDANVSALRAVLLADNHWGLRHRSALALGRIRTDDARAALFEGLESAEARVRRACVKALGDFRFDAIAADRLSKPMTSDPAWAVRAEAVTSLVRMRSKDALKDCYRALTEAGGQGVIRNAGMAGLVKLENTDALEKIKPLCDPGNERTYRHNAILSYAKLARHLERERDQEKAADYLAGMLDDWYLRTRRTVVEALGILGGPSSLEALEYAAVNDPVASVRRRARLAAASVDTRDGREVQAEKMEYRIRELEEKMGILEEELDESRRGGTSE